MPPLKHVRKMMLVPYSKVKNQQSFKSNNNIDLDDSAAEIERSKTVVEKTYSELDRDIVNILNRTDLNDDLKLKLYLRVLKQFLDFRRMLYPSEKQRGLEENTDIADYTDRNQFLPPMNPNDNDRKDGDSDTSKDDLIANFFDNDEDNDEDFSAKETTPTTSSHPGSDKSFLTASLENKKGKKLSFDKGSDSKSFISSTPTGTFHSPLNSKTILDNVDPRIKDKIRALLKNVIQPKNKQLRWNDDGVILLKGREVVGANIAKILENVIRTKKKQNVVGYDLVYNFLAQNKLIPHKYIVSPNTSKEDKKWIQLP
jgi:hypothetical protein